jgi:hypothetical protein
VADLRSLNIADYSTTAPTFEILKRRILKTTRTSSIVECGADGNDPVRLSPLPTVCSVAAVKNANGLDYAFAEAALFAGET